MLMRVRKQSDAISNCHDVDSPEILIMIKQSLTNKRFNLPFPATFKLSFVSHFVNKTPKKMSPIFVIKCIVLMGFFFTRSIFLFQSWNLYTKVGKKRLFTGFFLFALKEGCLYNCWKITCHNWYIFAKYLCHIKMDNDFIGICLEFIGIHIFRSLHHPCNTLTIDNPTIQFKRM